MIVTGLLVQASGTMGLAELEVGNEVEKKLLECSMARNEGCARLLFPWIFYD